MQLFAPALSLFLCLSFQAFAFRTVNIQKLGAKGDGKTLNTKIIQKAIDQVAQTGGQVLVPAGTFKTGTLFLKSNVELHLTAKATLLGSDKLEDYKEHKAPFPLKTLEDADIKYALIVCIEQENVRITGTGTINGNGGAEEFKGKGNNTYDRPFILRFLGCKHVNIEGVRIIDSPMWVQHYVACDRLTIRNIYVHSHVNWNNDGIDIDMCQNVVVEGCHIDADDDGLCFKGSGYRKSKNIRVSNCVIRSNCNALKFGTHSMAGLERMTVTNCVLMGSKEKSEVWARSMALAGIAIESVDGGDIKDITISNCVIDSVYAPFFVYIGKRFRKVQDQDQPTIGSIENIRFSNIQARNTRIEPSIIAGQPEQSIKNISFHQVDFDCYGTGKPEYLHSPVPYKPTSYPEIVMLGKKIPAWGMYLRHVEGIRFTDCTFGLQNPDPRNPLFYEKTKDFHLDGVRFKSFGE